MRQYTAIARMKAALVPGRVYRRADFARLSSNVDRHLQVLLAEGHIKKLSHGMYLNPKQTPFGEAPPETHSLLQAFLNDDHFVVYGPSQFNALGLGTTQLYNRTIVFNRKRVGEYTLGGRTYSFHRWREAPKRMTPEFLVVEVLNRLDDLAEDREALLANLNLKLRTFNQRKLLFAASHYGTRSTQKKLTAMLAGVAAS